MAKTANKQHLYAVRRKRLALLVEEFGGQAELARKLGASPMNSLGNPSYLSRMLSGKSREKGGKNIEGDTAAEIERCAGKPRGWLSRENDTDHSLSIDYSEWDQLTPEQQHTIQLAIQSMITGFLAGNERGKHRKAG